MLYELTVTLMARYNHQSTFDLCKLIADRLETICKAYRCSLVLELHQSGVPHAHGLVDLRDLHHRSRFLDGIRALKTFGRITLSQVLYEDTYKSYICKDIPKTAFVIGFPPLLHDYHDLAADLVV